MVEIIVVIFCSFIVENFFFGDLSFLFFDIVLLIENGIVDLIGIFEFVVFFEERYGIIVVDLEIILVNFDNIESFCVYIDCKINVGVQVV